MPRLDPFFFFGGGRVVTIFAFGINLASSDLFLALFNASRTSKSIVLISSSWAGGSASTSFFRPGDFRLGSPSICDSTTSMTSDSGIGSMLVVFGSSTIG